MNAMGSTSGVLPVDSSLINPEFIRRLQDQRVLHKQEVAFHLAEAEKYGAADEALASMIQAAEKIVAIMFPGSAGTAHTPDEATAEDAGGSPSWMEAAMAVVPKAAEPPAYTEPPAPQGLGNLMSDDRAARSGNMWRERLLGSRG